MNDETPDIHLAAGSQSVSITLHEPYGSMSDERRAKIVARSGAFHGELVCIVWIYDLHALRELLRVLDRMVGQPDRREWHSMEDELTLRFELSQTGHLQVHIALLDHSGDWSLPTTLGFTIRADQTYLPMWIQHVTEALENITH